MASINNLLAPAAGFVTLILALLVLALAAGMAALAVRFRRIERHYAALMHGGDGANLQALLESHVQELRSAVSQVRELDAETRRVKESVRGHVQHLGFVRFNPFRETGGDQSFVIALADGDGRGAVISSLHSRDQTRIYAKPLSGWTSPYPLTDEEQEGIRRAQQGEQPSALSYAGPGDRRQPAVRS